MSLTTELRSLEGNLEGALSEIPAAVGVLDRDGRFRWVNKKAVDIFGDVVGSRFSRLTAPDQLALARKQFARKLIGETTGTEYDLVLLDRRGCRITVRINSVALRRNGEVVGVFWIALPRPEARDDGTAKRPQAPALTARQYEVLQLLGEGLGTREIAARLGVSEDTARNHIRALLRELGVRSRLQAVVTGYRLGLLDPRN